MDNEDVTRPAHITQLLTQTAHSITGGKSTLFLVWDAGIDALIGHMVEENDSYINAEKKRGAGWKKDLEKIWHDADTVKNRIADGYSKPSGNLPTSEEIQEVSQNMYEWFDPVSPVGRFYREISTQVIPLMAAPNRSWARTTGPSSGPTGEIYAKR